MYKYNIFLFLIHICFLFGFKAPTTTNYLFHNWHCLGIKEKIDFTQPFAANIGELPLVIWKNPMTEKYGSTINICKHMGSKLDNAEITSAGCLKCKYHGFQYKPTIDTFGEVVEHEGKIFWAYKPINKIPEKIPYFHHKNFTTAFLEFDMDCSLKDSAFNTMDLRHPEYVHSGLFGFGNNIPPKNIKHFFYSKDKVGLSFDYVSKSNIQALNGNTKFTKNYHMYIYPSFSWSKVSFDESKHLIIGVNLLPIEQKKTRWFITICNNYFTTPLQEHFLKLLAFTILSQDYKQMKNQQTESPLKEAVLFTHKFEDEDAILFLHERFREYQYPSIQSATEIYKDSQGG
jgi:phenylpropionate dioxygenase-like ring-hydroxylating dioxygenase large terminal subunit